VAAISDDEEPLSHRPLASWRFRGELRRYQADVLDSVPEVAGEPLHIVAPPGSGKTLLGLLLAIRSGGRALVLAPTTTIRAQWARTAEGLEGSAGGVSEDPLALADVTALTYQALSVLETANPLAGVARDEWEQELVAGGRTPEVADAWLDALQSSNAGAFRSGIARRSRGLRRRLARTEPEVLEAVLHPNARALVDRLVAHGVETVVLDECHHLLDHWALVVAYLAARIRQAGGTPLLIGLTATLPSTEDADEYDNYTSLLGDVDYEIPTPAVVKEGNLAPYRDAVWFTTPDAAELDFLRRHETELATLVAELFATETGIAFTLGVLQPVPDAEPDVGLAAAYADDFALAEAASRMLARVSPEHPLVALLPADALDGPDTEQSIRLLARFALDRLLPDPDRAADWERVKGIIADFGYTLTDRGIRRGRDPLDTVLASSTSKDRGAAEILAGELLRDDLDVPGGFALRAVVVTDFAQHGNRRGSGKLSSGALRCFDTLVADPRLHALRPVLVTAKHLRIAVRDADILLPALADLLDLPELTTEYADDAHEVVEVDVRGAGSAAVVEAVSDLVTEGTVSLIVGTRALLGEGWDCPAINTLVDLTSVATSASTQQLRGRTLRLDPAWPRKVAHNWTVTTVVPPEIRTDGQPDLARMHRKHGRVWGLSREDSTQIVRGIGIALTRGHLDLLTGIVRKSAEFSVPDLDHQIAVSLPTRAQSYADWRIGEPYTDRERVGMSLPTRSVRPFRTGVALEFVFAALIGLLGIAGVTVLVALPLLFSRGAAFAVALLVVVLGVVVLSLIPLVRDLGLALRQRVDAPATYRKVVTALVTALHGMGRIREYGQGDLRVVVLRDGPTAVHVEAGLAAGPLGDQRLVADALTELFGPVRSPRFLLQVNRGDPLGSRHPVLNLAIWVTGLFARRQRFLPVPTAIARRREYAERFAAAWRREVGPCRLIEMDSPERLALLVEARRQAAGAPGRPIRRESWS
jgi:superfamily II DNA or RNA helicase